MDTSFSAQDFYISPRGNDRWSGRLAEPSAEGLDGPFATITCARDAVRALKASAMLPAALTVWLRGGTYTLAAPIGFTSDDAAPVTYAAYPGEQPIVCGGARIANWQRGQRAGHEVWTADASRLRYFRQLFVNGQRRHRARLPKVNINAPRNGVSETFYRMADVPGTSIKASLFDGSGANAFVAAKGDIQAWHNLTDVEVVALHYWIEERLPIKSFDGVDRAGRVVS